MRKEPPLATIGQTMKNKPRSGKQVIAWILRVALAILIPLIAFFFLYQGFLFLRAGNAPKWVIALVAIVWGVGGVAILYYFFNKLVESLSPEWTERLQPFVFVGPAIALLIWFLALPAVRTFYISLFGKNGPPALPVTMIFTDPGTYFAALATEFVGLSNYTAVFTDRLMLGALRNNIIFWIGIATPLTVIAGCWSLLQIAVNSARSITIFMPMAISFVGAGVIWNLSDSLPAGTSN
jgi:alpha-glucoside transport system permease protein